MKLNKYTMPTYVDVDVDVDGDVQVGVVGEGRLSLASLCSTVVDLAMVASTHDNTAQVPLSQSLPQTFIANEMEQK